jgi:hypothetical protein
MFEEYRQIEGYDNYSVSNMGNVRNDKTGRIRKPATDRDGYLCVDLWKKCKGKTKRIHRLVAVAFLENPDNLREVDHINRIKTDNQLTNLRLCSHSNNCRNQRKRNGTSKYFGVHWYKRDKKWRARINLNGKLTHLGYFKTEEEAYSIWCAFVFENNLQDFYGL